MATRLLASALAAATAGLMVGIPLAHASAPVTASTAAETPAATSFGSYLAGRHASNQHDTASAAEFFERALKGDSSNDALLEQAFLMQAMEGRDNLATPHAYRLIKIHQTHRMAQAWLGVATFKSGSYAAADAHFTAASSGPIAELTSTLARAWVALAAGDIDRALTVVDYPGKAEWAASFANYHKALIADVAGRTEAALAIYKAVVAQDPRTARAAMAYAGALAHAGRTKDAIAVLETSLARSGGAGHPSTRAMRDQLAAGKPVDRVVANPTEGMAEVFYGLGEALASEGGVPIGTIYLQLALALRPDLPGAISALAVVYEQTKRHERAIVTLGRIPPGSPLAQINAIRKASNLNALDRVDEAKDVLVKLIERSDKSSTNATTPSAQAPPPLSADEARKIAGPRRTPLNTRSRGESVRVTQLQTVLNRMGYDAGPADGRFGGRTADALRDLQRNYAVARSGRLDAATLTLLDDLSAGRRPQVAGSSRTPAATPNATDVSAARRDTILPLDALAGIMRARKRYKEATEYYTRIIDMLPKPERQHWTYWYARGTSYERLKQWPLAERDLKMALSLNKDQPLVLNYLGYSWIDQNRNLRQGLKMIERAVALKPEDGYIVDSLGWAHYRLGNFKTAVTYLEKAVELRADDPTLNDHLGDALWQVGRRREARFQWEQALTLNPEAEDEAKIRAKLQNGLVTPRRVATPARRARAVTRQSSAPTARAEN